MTLLYQDPVFLEHHTGPHPECAERLRRIAAQLEATGLDLRCQRPGWQPATLEQIHRVHDPEYVAAMRQFIERGGGRIEIDTIVSPRSYDAACMAAGAVCDAVDRVVAGEARHALCLVRPPGHHALQQAPMGFCLLNHIAIGARLAIDKHGLNHVLIVDWDVHHGNGTQDAFWQDDQVGFLSIHRFPFYPGTGDRDETGQGRGLGYTLNLPVPFGISRQDYLQALEDGMQQMAEKVQPELILVSAGFDAHAQDPIGSLGLEVEDFQATTDLVLQLANHYCDGRLISVLEGGYNLRFLPECVEAHLRRLLEAEGDE
jgi:acetoin utilization deacetylase AcuC-like enzyme